MKNTIKLAVGAIVFVVLIYLSAGNKEVPETEEKQPQTERIYIIPQHKVQDMLGFANYCLELHILEPDMDDLQRYYDQGGWEYYMLHIEKAIHNELHSDSTDQ